VRNTLAVVQGRSYNNLPVMFENVRILKPLEIPEKGMYREYKKDVIETGILQI
jgi:hypothetical protein